MYLPFVISISSLNVVPTRTQTFSYSGTKAGGEGCNGVERKDELFFFQFVTVSTIQHFSVENIPYVAKRANRWFFYAVDLLILIRHNDIRKTMRKDHGSVTHKHKKCIP